MRSWFNCWCCCFWYVLFFCIVFGECGLVYMCVVLSICIEGEVGLVLSDYIFIG